MKRANNLFDKITDIKNIRLAHNLAQRGKQHYTAVRRINKDPEPFLLEIQKMLLTNTFKTSEYKSEERFDSGKWRTIHKLPYYPDRIVQHAIMNICAPIWRKHFIRDTFQSIERRGTHDARKRIQKHIQKSDHNYAVKIDVQKFYPSVPNEEMRKCVRRTIKCKRTLNLLDDIINSHKGLPIGNYTSQYLGNLYLSQLDWWAKQQSGVSGYFRYCDDIVFIDPSKEKVQNVAKQAIEKLNNLKLSVKIKVHNCLIEKQGLDFCGFVFFNNKTKLRKKIASNIVETLKIKDNEKLVKSLASYWGWIKPINAKSFWRKLITKQILRRTDGIYKINPLRKTI